MTTDIRVPQPPGTCPPTHLERPHDDVKPHLQRSRGDKAAKICATRLLA